jgi:hypothetical protein
MPILSFRVFPGGELLMRRNTLVLVLLAGSVVPPLAASPPSVVRLDVIRDTWVSEMGPEADGNNGGAPRLKFKGIQEMSLLDVDSAPLRGRVITAAALHLKLAGESPLRRVTVGGIGAEWFEGTGSGYARQPGGATFRHRRFPDLAWSTSKPSGDLCNVILGNGGTSWAMADATSETDPCAGGWQSIAISPRVVAARAAGLSHGFLVFDDTGSEWTRKGARFDFHLFPNRFAFSRDQNRASAPYLTVSLGASDLQPPAAPSALTTVARELPPGEALVSWLTPRDQGPAGTLGFMATVDGLPIPRELTPLAGEPGARVEMHLRDLGLERQTSATLQVRAVDAAGNLGPAATLLIQLPGNSPVALPGRPSPLPHPAGSAELPRLGMGEVAVIDELDKVHPRTSACIPPQSPDYLRANHLWNAGTRTITLHAARNEFVAFQVLVQGRTLGRDFDLRPQLVLERTTSAGIQIFFGRYRVVPTPIGLLPDPIVPLGADAPRLLAAAKDPDASSGVPSQSLHVELYVPHGAAAGVHRGSLTLSSGQASLHVAVRLTVWDFTLPDHLSFLPEMNCYGLPDNERAYYRLAHRHRTVLNRLPYNQNGRVQDGCAPGWDGKRLEWASWDGRFGPLLDGSVFADLPRKGIPVECFYLPLHENWPTPMEGNYNGNYWADLAFPESYRRAFVAASRQFAAHLTAKGWKETLFHGFLNNKNNFKAAGWSRGSSPWLLDEPASFQDFWALRYFARGFHEGINQARAGSDRSTAAGAGAARPADFPRLVFRADISRPQWRRDALDGLLDYHVVGSAMRHYPRLVFDRKRRFGEIVVEYGGTNPVHASNFQPVGWILDAWSLGADGVLPWQTVGTADSWQRGDELALFYPLPAAGVGVAPSIRLKAYLRGQQDVEYLMLWSRQRGLPRWAVGQEVRTVLRLAGTRQATETGGAEDAGRIDYSNLRPQDLWSLRMRIGEALSREHPAARSRLVDFRTPPRDPAEESLSRLITLKPDE